MLNETKRNEVQTHALTCPTGTRIFFAPSATHSTSSCVSASNVKIVERSQFRIRHVSDMILSFAYSPTKMTNGTTIKLKGVMYLQGIQIGDRTRSIQQLLHGIDFPPHVLELLRQGLLRLADILSMDDTVLIH